MGVRKWSRWLVVSPLVVWVIYCMVLLALQRKMIFPRHLIEPAHVDPARFPGRVLLPVQHEQGTAEGWFFPGAGRTAQAPGPAVIFFHGNGELIDHAVFELMDYRQAGLSVALLEYRGYGRSDGDPSEDALVADAVAFFDQVAARAEVDPARIILHGRSLGGGVACGVAVQRPPHKLVLASTFTSIPDLAWRIGVPGFIVRDTFDNLGRLAHVRAPVFISHGKRDEIIPFSHGQALAKKAGVQLLALDCGHNDCESSDYWRQVVDWARSR